MARHFNRSPELLSPAQIEAYMLHLIKDRQLSYSSVNHAACASRFLLETVLGRKAEAHLRPPMARVPQKQPELLSCEQIAQLRADDKGGKRRKRLPGTEFIKYFLSHVLPTGIKRIRHYGVLASACKGKKLPLAKSALHMPQSNAQAQESARTFMSRVAAMDVLACPVCKAGRLRVVATALGLRQLPEAGASLMPCNRGPPP